ncbi:MAG: rhomboid family intramembrane serine protease [Bryobacteraceae bacterium]|nr:rhomboid family intramembrane serine protease [Bryobacteraceae bacterium]
MIPLRDTQPSNSFPFVTLLIIVANVLIFFFQLSLEPHFLNYFIANYGIVPDRFQLADLVTSMFLHGGWMHLIGNMWFLWIYGDNVEDVVGHGRFLLFYLMCGVAAGLVHVLLNADSRVPTVGASGAIAGVMGAYMVKFPRSKVLTLIPIFIFFTTVEIPAFFILLYWFVIQIFSGLGSVGVSNVSRGGVAWFAHIGGFVAGIGLVYLLGTRERFRHRSDLRW